MIVPDVNLMLYAEIDAYPQHEAARSWWEDTLSSERRVGLPAVALFGFLRIATNRRVFDEPLSLNDAVARVETWLSRSNVTFLGPGPRHLETAFQLLRVLGTGGNLTTDVQLAAHAIENQAELHSNDLDFGRFSGLRWVNPLATR
jgi:toxin-antitoxin system PIN domain toxin